MSAYYFFSLLYTCKLQICELHVNKICEIDHRFIYQCLIRNNAFNKFQNKILNIKKKKKIFNPFYENRLHLDKNSHMKSILQGKSALVL